MSNISDIISTITNLNGFAKTNRFIVQITPPSTLNVNESLNFLCDTINLPSVDFATENVKHLGYGLQEKRIISTTFDNVTGTFFIDNSGVCLQFFQQWMQLISPFDPNNKNKNVYGISNEDINYPEDYWGTITIYLKDSTNKNIQIYTLDKCHPINIGGISLGWEQNDTLARLPVSFTYRSFSTETTSSLPTTNNKNIETSSKFTNLNQINSIIQQNDVQDIVKKLTKTLS